MILDTLQNADRYEAIHPGITAALKAVADFTPENYQTGKVELDGDKLYLNCAAYTTHAADTAVMEAHRDYVDVMYMVEGEEIIYVKPTDRLQKITKPYDPAVEALLAELDADTTAVRLQAGCFVVLFPQDAHAPGCISGEAIDVKKIIGKVRIAK